MHVPQSSTVTGAVLAASGAAGAAVHPPQDLVQLVLQLLPILIGIYDMARRERQAPPRPY